VESQEFTVSVLLPEFTASISSEKLSDHSYRISAGEIRVTDGIMPPIGAVEYKWYYGSAADDLALIEDENQKQLELFGNASNGFYRAELEFTVDGRTVTVQTNVVEIAIDKIVITEEQLFDLSSFDLTDPANFFYYDGQIHSVVKSDAPIQVEFTDFEGEEPGKYVPGQKSSPLTRTITFLTAVSRKLPSSGT
jgi:hypothetical protein